ncbi:hypothetical protein ACS0TY_016302 [Phlomoides rotata]
MAGAYVMGNYSYKVDRREKEIIFNRILRVKDEGEAKSAQLIGYVISNNSACITLARIEASKEIAHILAASTNTVYLNSDELLSIFEI